MVHSDIPYSLHQLLITGFVALEDVTLEQVPPPFSYFECVRDACLEFGLTPIHLSPFPFQTPNYCSHRRTHTHTHTHARTQTHTHKYAHTHTNTLTHKYTYAPPPTHTHAYTGLAYTYNYMCRDLLVSFRAPTRFRFGNTAILKRRHKVWFSLPTARFVCARERQRERCCACVRTCVRVFCRQNFFLLLTGKCIFFLIFLLSLLFGPCWV